MEVSFPGAHNLESAKTRCVSVLVDGIIALDAGGLTSGLSFAEQQKIEAVLLTHRHYDHIKDIPMLAMNLFLQGNRTAVYSTREVYDILSGYLLDGELYPDFRRQPEASPTLKFVTLSADEEIIICGYLVKSVAVNHAVPTCGYEVTSPDGKTLFYSGDTGPGLDSCWQKISPQLLVIEVTSPNRFRDFGLETGHLTPDMLRQELVGFRELKGYLPRIVLVHMNPYLEEEIAREVAVVSRELDAEIVLASEGMRFSL